MVQDAKDQDTQKVGTEQRKSDATKFGAHFLQEWRNCPMRWWWVHRAPIKAGEALTGVVPKTTASPLLIGSLVHAGLEGYYAARWGKLEQPVRIALEAIDNQTKIRDEEWPDADTRDKDRAMAQKLLTEYDAVYGPEGLKPEDGEIGVHPRWGTDLPLIEQEFEAGLGFKDYVFTARIDTVVIRNGQSIWALEHKTTAASALWRLMARGPTDLQITGQIYLLRAFEDQFGLPIGGVIINALVKDRSQRSKETPFRREAFGRSDANLEKFRTDACRTLSEIEAADIAHRNLTESGMDPYEAALVVYTQNTAQCVEFRPCPYMEVCHHPGLGRFDLEGFRCNPRNVDEEDASE